MLDTQEKFEAEIKNDNQLESNTCDENAKDEFHDHEIVRLESDETTAILSTKSCNTNEESDLTLSEDIYGMIYVANFCSQGFVYGFLCFLFQYSICFLLVDDLILNVDSNNPFQIPPGITTSVRVSQCLAVILAVLCAEDLFYVISIFNLHNRSHATKFSGATLFKWLLSCGAKAISGWGLLIAIFALIVQSSDIISLFLNFAALQFVGEIDNVFFVIAQEGFLTKSLSDCANNVSQITLATPSRRAIIMRNISFYSVLVILLSCWIYLTHLQYTGHYLCDSFFVQFSDENEPRSVLFSGIYERMDTIIGYRAVYQSEKSKGVGHGVIAFCERTQAWTLSLKKLEDNGYDPCDWMAMSHATNTFDVTSLSITSWIVEKSHRSKAVNYIRYFPYSSGSILCLDCDNNINPSKKKCSGVGTCVNGKCECGNDFFGSSCEYLSPCETLRFDNEPGQPGGFSAKPGSKSPFGEEFNILRDKQNNIVLVRGKPVYYNVLETENVDLGIIFYNGLRWVVTRSSTLKNFDCRRHEDYKTSLTEFLKDDFHPYFTNYISYFQSSPIYSSTISDQFSPNNLDWFLTKPTVFLSYSSQGEINSPVTWAGPLLCTTCNAEHPCIHGKCIEGSCKCYNNCTTGLLCEIVKDDCSIFEQWDFS